MKKKTKVVVVPLDPKMKAQLDAMRARGYTLNGYIRAAIALALAGEPIPRGPRRAA
jgi:hypothetical protein